MRAPKIVFAFAASLILWSQSTLRADEPPAREQFHAYLLMGQSNMAGRGKMTEADRRPVPGVFALNKELHWVPAAHPLHWDKPAIAGVGLAMTFAQAMREKSPGIAVGLLPCAFGGSPLSRSSKGGDLYQNAILRAKAAEERGTLKGILWHQGETDAEKPELANTYAERLARMIADLRAELKAPELPFVAGGLGTWLLDSPRSPHARTVDQALRDLPRRVPHTGFVSVEGLAHKGDKVHFSSEALRDLGRRYVAEMLRITAP